MCNVVILLKYVNVVIFVIEFLEFGFYDLKMVIEFVKMYDIFFGIVINKDDEKDNIIKKYCKDEKINLIGIILYSKDIVVLYFNGEILYDDLKYKNLFDELCKNVKEVLKWN